MEKTMLWEGEESKIFQTLVPNWTPVSWAPLPGLDAATLRMLWQEAEQTAAFPGSVSKCVKPGRVYQCLSLPDLIAHYRAPAVQDSGAGAPVVLRSWDSGSLGMLIMSSGVEMACSVCKPR